MKIYFSILFILFKIRISDDSGSYSIDPFIDTLIKNGVYDLLKDIRDYFGEEIAKEVCLELYPTNDCEKVVRTYLPPPDTNQESDSSQTSQSYISLEVEEYTLPDLISNEQNEVPNGQLKENFTQHTNQDQNIELTEEEKSKNDFNFVSIMEKHKKVFISVNKMKKIIHRIAKKFCDRFIEEEINELISQLN